jgi:hypothetical protein
MSGPERHTPDDKLLEEFLDGRSPVAKAYRAASRPAAPPVLDDPVRKIARDARGHPVIVNARPRPLRRWRVPLALAATMVLGLGIVLQLQQDRAAYEVVFGKAPSPAARPVAPPSPAVEAEAPAPMAAERAAAQELAQGRQRAAEAPPRREPKRAVPPPPVADELQSADVPHAAGASAPERSGARMAEAAPAEQKQNLEGRAAPQTFATRPAPAADARARPEEWFAQMRVLRDDGRIDEARQMLYAFRRDYPEHELPEDLRDLEPPPAPAASPSSSGDR